MTGDEFIAAVIQAAYAAGVPADVELQAVLDYGIDPLRMGARWPDGLRHGIHRDMTERRTEELARKIGGEAAAVLLQWHAKRTASAA